MKTKMKYSNKMQIHNWLVIIAILAFLVLSIIGAEYFTNQVDYVELIEDL